MCNLKKKINFIKKLNMKNLILPLSIIFYSSIYSQDLQSGLVGHFPLDGDANDISSLSLNGVVNGPTASNGVLDQPNTAMLISETSSNYSINCGTSNRGITNQFSMSIWMKSTSTSTNHFISKYDWNLDGGFYIGAYQNKAILAGRDGSGQFIYGGLGTTTINDGAWHHIVATCDGNTWNLYVDCNLETSISTTTNSPDLTCGMPLTIGHYYYGEFGDYRIFDGSLDDARLYDRALDPTEVSMLCRSSLLSIGEDLTVNETFKVSTVDETGIYKVNREKEEDYCVEIYNLNGQFITSKYGSEELNIQSEPTGLYFLFVKDMVNNVLFNQKIIKF